jgi:hypothetical protein
LAFFGGVAVLVLLKLWLTSEIRVLPAVAPHDASNYLEHAKAFLSGEWFGPYDNLTLIKGPAFPLYMAAVQELGLPLPLAHQLLYAAASVVACLSVGPLIRSVYSRLAVFAVLLYNPMTFGFLAWVTFRSQLTESLALIVVACAFAIFVRRREPARAIIPWLLTLDVTFAAFWHTREEGIWVVPCLALLLGAYVWAARRDGNRELVRRVALLSTVAFVWTLASVTFTVVNGQRYGWYTTVELQSPEFISAYNSLARIEVAPVYHVPVPRAAREIAYAVSPAAAQLRAGLEGARGKDWTSTSCTTWSVCGDIGGGWFMWSFRDAVAVAGHYSGGAEARTFYITLARELDAACDSGKMRCRRKARTLAPPLTATDLPAIGSGFVEAIRVATTISQFSLDHWPPPARNPALEQDYEFVTRAVLLADPAVTFEGWIVHGPLHAVEVDGPNGPDPAATISFGPSPDIRAVFARDPKHRGHDIGIARFRITGACVEACFLVVTDALDRRTRIPLAASIVNFRDTRIDYHLDRVSGAAATPQDVDDRAKRAVLRRIAWLYQTVLPYAIALALTLTVLRCVRALRRRSLAAAVHATFAVGVLASAASLLLILAVIDATSFPALSPEYMGGLFPLLLFFAATTIAVEVTVARRLMRSGLAATSRLTLSGLVLLAGTIGAGAFLSATSPPRPAPAAAVDAEAGRGSAHAFSCVRPISHRHGIARGSVDAVQVENGGLFVRGWAATATLQRPLAGVCIAVDGRIVARESVSYGTSRPDVSAAFGNRNLRDAGYEARVGARELTRGVHQVSVIAIDEHDAGEQIGSSSAVTIR